MHAILFAIDASIGRDLVARPGTLPGIVQTSIGEKQGIFTCSLLFESPIPQHQLETGEQVNSSDRELSRLGNHFYKEVTLYKHPTRTILLHFSRGTS